MKYALALLVLMASPTNAQSPHAVNPYQAQAQREGEQAVREGRFPELKGLTNSQADQMKVFRLCEKYHGVDSRICSEAAGVYMLRGDRELATDKRQQAADEADALARDSSDARESLASGAEQEAFDQCMHGRSADPASCVGSARAEVAVALQAEAQRTAQHASDEAHRVQQQALDEARRIVKEKLDACMRSTEYQLFTEANRIVWLRLTIRQAQESLDRDKAVERMAGVIDLKVRSETGQILVGFPPQVEQAFAEYSKLGGTASSSDDVVAMADPCEELQK